MKAQLNFSKLCFTTLSLAFFVYISIFRADGYATPPTDTGLKKCFNNETEIECPQVGEDFFGQDGNYHGLESKFIDNGDGTVKSNITYLEYEKTPQSTRIDYDGASRYCSALNMSGKGGWRIPTRKELLAIFSYNDGIREVRSPFVSSYWSNYSFWTSTEVDGLNACISYTNFGVNFVKKTYIMYVLCVRDLN